MDGWGPNYFDSTRYSLGMAPTQASAKGVMKGWARRIFFVGMTFLDLLQSQINSPATMLLIGECSGGNQTETMGQEWFSNVSHTSVASKSNFI